MFDKSRIQALIAEFDLDLTGVTVITECATGVYAYTGPIAALAGADNVLCLGRDSDFGTFEDAQGATQAAAAVLEVQDRLRTLSRSSFSSSAVEGPDVLVTNLYGVRPIDEAFASSLPRGGVVSTMCEFWELRSSDVDLDACRRRGLPIVSTDESHPLLRTMDLVGLLAIHMLLECGAPFASGRVAIIGQDPFSRAVEDAMTPWVRSMNVISSEEELSSLADQLGLLDAVVVADHEARLTESPAWLAVARASLFTGTHFVNVSGFPSDLASTGVSIWPPRRAEPRAMSRALDVVGCWPVLRLHVAGLKVGSLAMKNGQRRPHSGIDNAAGSTNSLVERLVR